MRTTLAAASRRAAALLLAAAALGLAACDDPLAAPDPVDVTVRFVNAAPATARADLRWNGDDAFSAVDFGTAAASGQYKTLQAPSQVAVVGTGATTVLTAGTFDGGAGRPFTLALVQNLGFGSNAPGSNYTHTLVVLTDTNTAPAAGKARLRVAHLAPLASGRVDVYVTAPGASLDAATPTAAALPLMTASSYLELAAGTYQVRLTAQATKTVLLDAGTITLGDGAIRTLVAMDPTTGVMPLRSLVLTDRN